MRLQLSLVCMCVYVRARMCVCLCVCVHLCVSFVCVLCALCVLACGPCAGKSVDVGAIGPDWTLGTVVGIILIYILRMKGAAVPQYVVGGSLGDTTSELCMGGCVCVCAYVFVCIVCVCVLSACVCA